MINLIIIFSILNILLLLVIILYGNKIFILDKPDSIRKHHKHPVPLAGGIIILINILSLLLFSQLSEFKELNYVFFNSRESIFSFYCGSCLVFLVGIYDDKYNIRPNIKLVLLFIIVLVVILIDSELIINELYFSSLNFHTTLDNFSIFFTILCILLFLNAINMFDGINMQVSIYALSLFVILTLINNSVLFFIPIIICLFVVIFLNSNNKLFLGDSGSLLLGYIIAYFVIKSYNISSTIIPEEIFLLMLVPGIDMFRLFLQRIISNRNPFKPDNNHLHHMMIKKFSLSITLVLIQLLILLPIIFYYLGFINIVFSIAITLIFYLFILSNFLCQKKL